MPNREQKAAELKQAALEYHEFPTPGKLSVNATKQMVNQRDLALAYSPGVAAACEAIVADPAAAFRYTARGNLVAVVTNGTADSPTMQVALSGVILRDLVTGQPVKSLAFAALAPLPTTRSCPLLITLPPGLYSAQVSGVGGTTGVALVEVYEMP